MIGDNLEWEVEAPQRLGIYAIWLDAHGQGLPSEATVKPDRIIRSLTELLPFERGQTGGSAFSGAQPKSPRCRR
jgi:putative hydrolase of the HAD superfamily